MSVEILQVNLGHYLNTLDLLTSSGVMMKNGEEIEFDQPGTGLLMLIQKDYDLFCKSYCKWNWMLCETTLTVNPNPTAETIPDYILWWWRWWQRNNGITLSQDDFNALIPSILGDNQSSEDFTVSFHSSEAKLRLIIQ